MITIMHLLSMNSLSGAEKVAINIINHLESEEFHFVYVSLDGPIHNVLENEKIEFMPIKKMSISEVHRTIKKINPDIIHAHDNRASVTAALSSLNIPIISHLHSSPSWMGKVCIKSIVYGLTTIRYKVILTVSNNIKKISLAIRNSDKAFTVYNPIDIFNIQKISEDFIADESDIVFSGRLCYQKNPIYFLDIIKTIVANKDDLKVIMLGDGELKEDCLTYITANNLQNNVIIKGFVSNPYPYMKSSKILCSTSHYEGLALVAIEAMCLGLPVVSTQYGGIEEVNKHLVTGFNCLNKKDYIEAINKLLSDKNLYNQMSYEAKNHMLEFEKRNNYYKKIKDIYLDITC